MASTARALLTAMLAPLVNDGVVVRSYLDPPDTIAKPTVLVSVEKVRPSVAEGLREYEAQLLATVPQTTAGAADDAVDLLLDDLLDLLDSNDVPNAVAWSEAVRSTYRDSTPAYLLTLTVTTEIAEGEATP